MQNIEFDVREFANANFKPFAIENAIHAHPEYTDLKRVSTDMQFDGYNRGYSKVYYTLYGEEYVVDIDSESKDVLMSHKN